MSEIESRVKSIIVEKLNVDEAEVQPEASFTNDLGADPLDTVELIMEFEKAFGINIPDDQAEKIATVGGSAFVIALTVMGAMIFIGTGVGSLLGWGKMAKENVGKIMKQLFVQTVKLLIWKNFLMMP